MNSARIMMIGIGTPSSHSSAPRPNPMTSSISSELRKQRERISNVPWVFQLSYSMGLAPAQRYRPEQIPFHDQKPIFNAPEIRKFQCAERALGSTSGFTTLIGAPSA